MGRSYDSRTEWDAKFDEYRAHSGMPDIHTPLYNQQRTQLGNGHSSLNTRIKKCPGEEKGWKERRKRLLKCNEKSAMRGMRAEYIQMKGMGNIG